METLMSIIFALAITFVFFIIASITTAWNEGGKEIANYLFRLPTNTIAKYFLRRKMKKIVHKAMPWN